LRFIITFFVNLRFGTGKDINQQFRMILKNLIGTYFFICIFFTGTESTYAGGNSVQDLEKLNSGLQACITANDTAKARVYLNLILKTLREENNDNITTSNSQYYIGVYYLFSGNNSEAINWLKLSASMCEQLKTNEGIHSKCLFNLGIAYSKLGDFGRMEEYTLKSIDIEKKLYGDSSPQLLRGYSALVNAYYGLNEYNKAILYGNKALSLSGGSMEYYKSDMAILYSNIGVCHARLSDYSKAVLYLEKAESIYKEYSLPEDENYINLLNSLAANYFFLGLNEKSDEYFNKGIAKTGTSNSVLSLNFMNSFAIVLGNAGKVSKGADLIVNALEKAKRFYGPDSRDYFEVLKNYAEYLRTYKVDLKKSLGLYEQCILYLNSHEDDYSLREPVLLGYSLALSENGESVRGLETIQKLLFTDISGKTGYSSTENPVIDLIEPVQRSINVLKAKYTILWEIYSSNHKIDYLLAASETSELIIALIEKVRINISEDESRLVLGDRYRDSYLFTIRDFDICYKNTGNKLYLEKAFEYSEKSKVAGLLASTRELKATQFHIPNDISELERRLKMEISFYEARISEENLKRPPDSSLISDWKGSVLTASQKRDSLIALIEKQYPEYYLIKYNTEVIKPADIPGVTGRNTNYLNYVVSDSVLYIFLANRKNLQLITIPIDSGFFNDIRQFRNQLSMPSDNAKSSFVQFNKAGINLYKKVIEPVRKYLISNKLLISPDNILSYIPFEALPVMQLPGENILFNEIPYLMNEFRISYTYSATLLSESLKKDYSLTNSLIAFAPVYSGTIDVDSLLNTRQTRVSTLHDLQYARTEAEYVTDLTGGKLYINNNARESVFKAEAGKYDIIHLAMHTVLNDQYPMYSKMLFSQVKDSVEDGNLNTYEVYGVPLNAKMVILSSCNTGTGVLHSGEGIQSLARGFVYSGSQSVVMSMWEIEDRSGAEIVKSYYKYLRNGASKSNALRKARISYLKNADMLRSHPYFWSALVIYGNNDPLYYSTKLALISGSVILLIFVFLIINYRKLR
jgi:CHAT domain-containing protein